MKKYAVHKSIFEKNIQMNTWILILHKLQCGLSLYLFYSLEKLSAERYHKHIQTEKHQQNNFYCE
jgi:hypothetical protein